MRTRTWLIAIALTFLLAQTTFPQKKSGRDGSEETIDWTEKIEQAKKLVSNIEITHSNKLTTYKEYRRVAYRKHGRLRYKTIAKVRSRDYVWKEAALAIFNPLTQEIKIIKIKKDGQQLINEQVQFMVSFELRVSGVRWNGRNNSFIVTGIDGSHWVVIAEKWLDSPEHGSNETIYVPYSRGLHQRELVELGSIYLDDVISMALYKLGKLNVYSRAMPAKKVADTSNFHSLRRLALTEHSDPEEFFAFRNIPASNLDPFERILIRLAVNGAQEFHDTASKTAALGLMQFENIPRVPTWRLVQHEYPNAKLPEFTAGATNHVESVKAAALLCDYNLSILVQTFGPAIADDPNLEYYLAAGYNGGIGRVKAALKRSRAGWRNYLKSETKTYLEKLDYLKTHSFEPN